MKICSYARLPVCQEVGKGKQHIVRTLGAVLLIDMERQVSLPFASAPRALSTLVLCSSHHYCLLWRRVLSLAWEPLGTCIWVLAHRLCSDSLDCFELGCNDFSQDLEILPFRILDVFSNIRLSPNGCTLLSYQ